MKLDLHELKYGVCLRSPDRQLLIKPYLERSQPAYEPSTWVQLLELPSVFSHDQALLLCQQSAEHWLVWIPDHGEVVLHTSQFYAE